METITRVCLLFILGFGVLAARPSACAPSFSLEEARQNVSEDKKERTVVQALNDQTKRSNTVTAKSNAERGWKLVIKGLSSDDIWHISPQGVKMEVYIPRRTYVAKAPDWTLFIYDDQTRTYAFKTKQTWSHQWRSLSLQQYTKGVRASIAGLKATQYALGDKVNGWSEFYIADLPLPAELRELASFLGPQLGLGAKTEVEGGVVLQVAKVDANGRRRYLVTTTSCEPSTIPPSTFEVPRGYRQGLPDWHPWSLP